MNEDRFNPDRDVRLSLDQLVSLIDAAQRRERELRKRNERMDGSKPGMMAWNDREMQNLRGALQQMVPARAALSRKVEQAAEDLLAEGGER